MDYPKDIKHLSLCAGYGGIDLGLKRALRGVRTLAFVEIEAFNIINLAKKIEAGKLDQAPIFSDLKAFPYSALNGCLDIISGGFPCQPFSSAGQRRGDSDPRHLWPFIREGVRAARPALVFLENVEGILSSRLKGDGWSDPADTPVLLHILRELERLGYQATAGVFSAREIGAPHRRKRVFILGLRGDLTPEQRADLSRHIITEPGSANVANADNTRDTPHGHHVDGHGATSCERWGGLSLPKPCRQRDIRTAYPAPRGADVAYTCHDSRRGTRTSVHSDGRAVDGRGASVSGERRTQNANAQPASRAHRRTAYPAPRGADQYEWEPPRVTRESVGDTKHYGHPTPPLRGGDDEKLNSGRENGEDSKRKPAGTGAPLPMFSRAQSVGDTPRGNERPQRGKPRLLPTQGGEGQADRHTRTDHTRGAGVQRQVKPPLGRDAHGAPRGLGYAELCHAVDNRTDELRALGNGVVPDTAARAFRVLIARLL